MIILELSEDKFGKAMKALTCIVEKTNMLKSMFEEDSMGYRHHEDDEDEDYEQERRYNMRGGRSGYRGRYM